MTLRDHKSGWWTQQRGPGPVIATAIHDGHGLRAEVAKAMKLPDADRFREEDPFTGQSVLDVPSHIIVHKSRFEADLNRGRDNAIYETPDMAWGLDVWHERPPRAMVAESLAYHQSYYSMLGAMLDDIAARHDRFVVIDVHSYNHRRNGPDAPPTPHEKAPDVNIGTFSMPRDEWAWILDPFIKEIADFDFNGRQLDVRENVAFQGKGEQTRFIHERYPGKGCAIAFEFKKFFMDEWSGAPDPAELDAMRALITHLASKCDEWLSAK